MKCQCREVLVDHVAQRISHPFRECPFYGTFTPMDQGPEPRPASPDEASAS